MKTYQPTAKEVKRNWQLVDAKEKVLGRISTQVAMMLMGKNKATYSPHMDNGDFVVLINAKDVVLTGKKVEQKKYRSHSGYPGGFKEVSYKKMREEHPERIIEHAVSGMLPDNRLKAKRMVRLFVYMDDKHPYGAKFKKN